VDITGSGSCPLAGGFGNDCPEPPDSATRILIRLILRKWYVSLGGGENWLRIMSSGSILVPIFFCRLIECRRAGGIIGRHETSMSSALRRADWW
jgi:hypothetical protein